MIRDAASPAPSGNTGKAFETHAGRPWCRMATLPWRPQVPAEANNPVPFGVVRFSPDQTLLAAAVEGRIHVLDGFSGSFLYTLETGVPRGGTALEFCFSPDSQFLLSGAPSQQPRCTCLLMRVPCAANRFLGNEEFRHWRAARRHHV